MTPDRWEEVRKLISNQFEVTDEYSLELDPGTADVLEFISPLGKLQVRFVKKPKVLDTKTTYSNRVGSDVKVEQVLSDEETVSHLEVFKWDDAKDDWSEFSADGLF